MTAQRFKSESNDGTHGRRRGLLAAMLLIAVAIVPGAFGGDEKASTLTREQAQASPQADVFMAFEQALNDHGIDATEPFVTPARLQEMKQQLGQMSDAEFRVLQAQMRAATPRGAARRATIESLVVTGDRAVLTARSGPHLVDEVHLRKIGDDWKVDIDE